MALAHCGALAAPACSANGHEEHNGAPEPEAHSARLVQMSGAARCCHTTGHPHNRYQCSHCNHHHHNRCHHQHCSDHHHQHRCHHHHHHHRHLHDTAAPCPCRHRRRPPFSPAQHNSNNTDEGSMPLHTHTRSVVSSSSSSSCSACSCSSSSCSVSDPLPATTTTTLPVHNHIDGPEPHVTDLQVEDDDGTDQAQLVLTFPKAHAATGTQSDTALPPPLQTTLPTAPVGRAGQLAAEAAEGAESAGAAATEAAAAATDEATVDSQKDSEVPCVVSSLGVPDGDLDRDLDGNQDGDGKSDVETVDSHTLAWDQTRLRIAYLVTTMVTPSADAQPIMDGPTGTSLHDLPLQLQDSVPAAAGAGPAALFAGDAPLFAGDALVPEMSEVGHYMDQCPKGWNHTAVTKKREKVAQVLYWQGEVTELGDEVFCGCSVGTTTPYDMNDDSGGGSGGSSSNAFAPVAQSRGSHASSEAALPRLSTVVSGATTFNTSAAGRDRSSTASPASFSLSTPSSSLSSSLSSPSSLTPGSPGGPSWRRCTGCKKQLMPLRTIVLVSSSTDDFPWVQQSDDGSGSGSGRGGPGSGFRKALRSIRGLVGLSRRRSKKAKVEPRHKDLQNPDIAKIAATGGGGNALFFGVPDHQQGVRLVGPTSPMPSARKTLPEARMWELWDETNCGAALPDHVAAKDEWALFFPATDMYRGLRKDAVVAAPVGDGVGGGGGVGDNVDAADANLDDIIDDVAADDDDDDDDDPDPAAKERRKKRETAERLRRAQALLEQHK